MATLTELLALIETETQIKPAWEDPAFLADLLPRLASLYASLGPFIADAEHETDAAEISYRVAREGKAATAIETGVSIGLANSTAFVGTAELRLVWMKLKHKARLLFLARQSLDRTIDSIRSKLAFLKSEKGNFNAS